MGSCCTLAKNKIFLEDKDPLFLFYLYSTVEGIMKCLIYIPLINGLEQKEKVVIKIRQHAWKIFINF